MEKEKYEILLAELADVLKKKNETIILQNYEIDGLKKKLEAAEKAVLRLPLTPHIEKRGGELEG